MNTDAIPGLRVFAYCAWADALEPAGHFLRKLPHLNVALRLPPGSDARLLRMASLDAHWHGESVRCLAEMRPPGTPVVEASTFGAAGAHELIELARRDPGPLPWWIVFYGQEPQKLAPVIGPLLAMLRKRGARVLYYAFDEASRTMPCFNAMAPHLDVLIHDESPLAEPARRALPPDCLRIHRSWVANLVHFHASFRPEPDQRILFLGSQLGLTEHRRRQIEYLRQRFKDRLVAIHDHSVSVADRISLNRFKVSVCPEGRKFATPAMAQTHTDGPFWSGCLGLVPVAEDSRAGGRLQGLAEAGLILRYPHGDLASLGRHCEEAFEVPVDLRRRIHQHFNQHETVGTVAGAAIARVESVIADVATLT